MGYFIDFENGNRCVFFFFFFCFEKGAVGPKRVGTYGLKDIGAVVNNIPVTDRRWLDKYITYFDSYTDSRCTKHFQFSLALCNEMIMTWLYC